MVQFTVELNGEKKYLTLEEFAYDNTLSYEDYRKHYPKRYYVTDENGNRKIKEFNLVEWLSDEIEKSKFILKEDFIDELAKQGIDVFTYEQDVYTFDDYTPLPDQVKFMCILKAFWKFKNFNFYYTNQEIEEAFGIKNIDALLDEMVEQNWISVDLVEGHPEFRSIYELW